MSRQVLFFAVAAFTATLLPPLRVLAATAASPSPSALPDCAEPNVKAHTIYAAPPSTKDVPRGVTGRVEIMIGLDEKSQIESARIIASPAAPLNGPALDAVHASKFQTEIRGCRPIAGKYVFTIDFP